MNEIRNDCPEKFHYFGVSEPTSGSLSVPTVIGSFETTLSHAKPEEKRIMQTLAQMINGSHHLNV